MRVLPGSSVSVATGDGVTGSARSAIVVDDVIVVGSSSGISAVSGDGVGSPASKERNGGTRTHVVGSAHASTSSSHDWVKRQERARAPLVESRGINNERQDGAVRWEQGTDRNTTAPSLVVNYCSSYVVFQPNVSIPLVLLLRPRGVSGIHTKTKC